MCSLSYSPISYSKYKHLIHKFDSKMHSRVRTLGRFLLFPSQRPNENEIIIKANGLPLDMHALTYEIETRGNKSFVWGIIITGKYPENAKHGIEKSLRWKSRVKPPHGRENFLLEHFLEHR